MPSTASPLLAWKLRTASSVSGPKMPSTLMWPSASWSSRTCRPSLPEVRTMTCSVVVVGSGFGADALTADPLARLAVGPTVNAARAPIEARLAREPAGTNRSSAARRRARERPSESSHASTSARSRSATTPSRASRRAANVGAGRTAARLRPRLERPRRARDRSSEAFHGSRAARSRGHPGMRGVLSPSIPLLGAYGVSCRARVNVCATPHFVAIRPRSLGCTGSPDPRPRGVEDSARRRQTNRSPCKMRYRGRSESFFADGTWGAYGRAGGSFAWRCAEM